MIDWKPDWSELDVIARARDDIREFARVEFVEQFFPMGLCVQLETNDRDLLQATRESFGRYPRLNTATTPDIMMRLFADEVDDALEPQRRPQSLFRLQGDYFYISAGRDAIVMGDRPRGRAFGFLPRSLVRHHDFLRMNFINGIVFAILMTRGFVGMHGAGLVKEGRSLMLRAKPGSGKSTLAFACVRRGYQLLGEDQVWVHWDSPQQEWWGAPWTLSLLPDAKNIFPELADYSLTVMFNGERKIVTDLDIVAPGAAVTTTLPGILVFLERHTAPGSQIFSVEPREAYRRFLMTIIEPPGPSQVGYTTAAEQLLARRAYMLRVGTDLDAAVNAVDELLQRGNSGARI